MSILLTPPYVRLLENKQGKNQRDLFGKLTGEFSTPAKNQDYQNSLKKLLHFLKKYTKLKTANKITKTLNKKSYIKKD